MAYDISDKDLAKYLKENERPRVNMREQRYRGRPDPRGLAAEKGSFGLGRATFYPTDIPGLIGWYRSDNGVSADPATGRVRAWQDLSGAGNSLLPVAVMKQPTVVGANWDGKPTVHVATETPVDGLQTAPGIVAPLATLSVFHVISPTTGLVNGNQTAMLGGVEADPFQVRTMLGRAAGVTTLAMYAGSLVLGTHPVTTAAGARHICSFVFNGASSRCRVDQGADDTLNPGANTPTSWALSDPNIAKSTYDHAEMLVYNRAVSLAEQAQIEQYLSAAWNVV